MTYRSWLSPELRGFHWAFATGVACQHGALTLPDTWFRPPFWDLLMLQLLRPNSSNLPCLYSTFHLEYPLVLSRFCFKTPSPLALASFGTFWALFFNLFDYFLWLRITDEGSIPEMRIWSILLIKSDLKWCIHLSRSLYLYFNYLVSVTAGGPRSPRGHM